MDLALLRTKSPGMAGERMGEDVALLHDRHEFADHFVGVGHWPLFEARPELPEMNVQGKGGRRRHLLAGLDDLEAPARLTADLGVRLDAPDECPDLDRAVKVRIEVPFEARPPSRH